MATHPVHQALPGPAYAAPDQHVEDAAAAAAHAAASARDAAAHVAGLAAYYTCPRCQLDRPVVEFLLGDTSAPTLSTHCHACMYQQRSEAMQQLLAAQVGRQAGGHAPAGSTAP